MSTQDEDVQNLEVTRMVDLMDGWGCDHENDDSFCQNCLEETLSTNLREFLENPPSDEITSLTLTGLLAFEEMGTLSPEIRKLWTSFVAFWYTKLRSLEVDYFDSFFCPMESFVNTLLSLPNLERFVCSEVRHEHDKQPLITDFPQRLFYLQNLKVERFSMNKQTLLQFYERLASNHKLQTYETYLTDDEDCLTSHFQGVIQLLKESRVSEVKLELYDDWQWNEENRRFGEVHTEFGKAVAGSKAKITISGLFPRDMYIHLEESLGNEAHRFFKCVEWTEELSVAKLAQFPNLKKLDRLTGCAETYPVFPESLERVRMTQRFPLNLISSLTHLGITEHASTCFELVSALMSLSRRCPQLRKLQLDWKLIDGLYADELFTTEYFQIKNPFPSLRTLELTFDADSQLLEGGFFSRVFKKALDQVLLKGFKLPELSLSRFTFRCSENIKNKDDKEFIGLSESTLTKIMEGNLPKTLVYLDIFLYTSSQPFLSTYQLANALTALNKCTQLEFLALNWIFYVVGEYVSEPHANPNFERGQSFESLDTLRLTFAIKLFSSSNPRGAYRILEDGVLLKGFKLPELSLRRLELRCGGNVNRDCGFHRLGLTEDGLQRMSNGKLANALQELHIDECLLEKSAESMLTTLKSCIEKRNRVSSPISEEDSHSE